VNKECPIQAVEDDHDVETDVPVQAGTDIVDEPRGETRY
jgi:hypothetical protein